jgi:hypothetical protein
MACQSHSSVSGAACRPDAKAKGLGALFDRYYMLPATLVAALVIYLNYHAMAMQQGLMNYYYGFKRVILAGFDPSVGMQDAPAFPMWGYGWMLALTENKLALLIMQTVLALLATWLIIRYVEQNQLLSAPTLRVLKILVVCSLPWYGFHAVRWPHSINVSLFTISFVLLNKALVSGRLEVLRLVLSGILFGLALNFRSDYLLMPFGLAAASVFICRPAALAFAKTIIWMMAVYVMLVPWMLYTWRATGTPLVSSTNGGHVLFIGLGNLPGNKWGITPVDSDPEMHRLLLEHFGKPVSSLGLDADRFLKKEFIKRVLENPGEYLHRCGYALIETIFSGAYGGEFELLSDDPNVPGGQIIHGRELLKSPRQVFAAYGAWRSARWVVRCACMGMGYVVVAMSYIFLPVVIIWAIARKNLFWLLLTLAIVYQAMLMVFMYVMNLYSANMYLFFLFNLVFGASLVLPTAGRLFAGSKRCA